MNDITAFVDEDGFAYRACWPGELLNIREGKTNTLPMDSFQHGAIIERMRPGKANEPWLQVTNRQEVRTWLRRRMLIRIQIAELDRADYFVYDKPSQMFVRAGALAQHYEEVLS